MAQILLLLIETKKNFVKFHIFFLDKIDFLNTLSNRRRPFQVHYFRKWGDSCHKNLQNKIQIVSQPTRADLITLSEAGSSDL